MALFKNKTGDKKDKSVPASAPEEPESEGEIEHSSENTVEESIEESLPVQYQQVPVVMSRSQLDNMNIETNVIVKENNIILKELIVRSED